MPDAERRNITQPADWWIAFEEAAAKKGVDLSMWIGDACKAALPKRTAAKLSARKVRGRPRKERE